MCLVCFPAPGKEVENTKLALCVHMEWGRDLWSEGRPEQGTGGFEGASVLSDPGSTLTKLHCCGPGSCSVWFDGRR